MISKKVKIVTISLSILILMVGSYYFYNFLTREPYARDVIVASPELAISSELLVDRFLEDEQEANAAYMEKVIEVEGEVKEVTFLNNRYTVLLYSGSKVSYVMCDMRTEQAEMVRKLNEGDKVKLKGVFKGFLMDAIMLNCVLQ
ncbi:OB-fold putative lipoprotein [Flagellimonas sp. HMM57]|uniref:OB-fold protein n=1 Tax=unclassified Flagellimonas TaxID=2644544 RepID=UPI0013D45815|nr:MULTISPECIES: hypothetical protein [unclassified Flagellimonas]UII77309.1 OB-fold putative lipoprotein [Flagellimonas sp. HMM57]